MANCPDISQQTQAAIDQNNQHVEQQQQQLQQIKQEIAEANHIKNKLEQETKTMAQAFGQMCKETLSNMDERSKEIFIQAMKETYESGGGTNFDAYFGLGNGNT
jgi:seryl-tRNA synthetase